MKSADRLLKTPSRSVAPSPLGFCRSPASTGSSSPLSTLAYPRVDLGAAARDLGSSQFDATGPAPHEHGPDDTRHLVGERHRRGLRALALEQLLQPAVEGVGLPSNPLKNKGLQMR
jgi:hypothetical protein